MKIKSLLAVAVLSLVVLAGCTSGTTVEKTTLSIPEIGIEVTVNSDWTYEMLNEERAHLIQGDGTNSVTIEPFGPPAVPAEVSSSPEGLAAALEEIEPGFSLTSQETFANGFLIDYSVGTDEAFSSIIDVNGTPYLCEPNEGTYLFEFDSFKEICKSVAAQ